jgi:hypothetical protein
MGEARRREHVIWMAVVHREVGYVLDAYPAELARYRRELGAAIRGEFATSAEAAAAVVRACRRPRHGRNPPPAHRHLSDAD